MNPKRAIFPISFGLLILAGCWFLRNVENSESSGSQELAGLGRVRSEETSSMSSSPPQRSSRDDQIASKVKSLLLIAPNEIGLIRVSSQALAMILPSDSKDGDLSPMTFVSRDVVADKLEKVLRDGQVAKTQVALVDEKIDWRGSGIAVSGGVDYSFDDGTCQLSILIEGTEHEVFSIQVMGRTALNSVAVVRLPGLGSDSLLIVPAGE